MAELNKAQLQSENQNSFPNNNAGAITPEILRNFNTDMIDSLVDEISYQADSASFDNRINALDPGNISASLDALNDFTASQIVSNSLFETKADFNQFTQSYQTDSASFNSRINSIPTVNTGSFATTGSNTFTGQQNISGSNSLNFNNGGFTIQDTIGGVALLDSQNGIQVRNFTSNDIQIEQNANASVTIDNNSGSIEINAHRVGQAVSISGSTINLNGVNFNGFSQSVDSRLDSLEGAGYVTSTITGSSLITASFDNGTRNLTFTKGDSSTFSVTIPDASGSSPINTGSFATTGSNNFNGNQTISGSVIISSSAATDLTVNNTIVATGSQGRIQLTANGGISATTSTSPYTAYVNTFAMEFGDSSGNGIGFTPDSTAYGISGWSGPSIYGNDPTDSFPAFIGFQNKTDWTDGRITALKDLYVSGNIYANNLTGSGGGGTAVGAITTGSNGAQQYITGSLGINTLNQVLAINTTYTASIPSVPNEGATGTTLFVSYSSNPNSYPNLGNIDASGNWSVSGSGVNNQIITSVNGDDNGFLIEAGGATFTNGANYTIKAAAFLNTLNVNDGLIQLQTDSGNGASIQVGNNAGDGAYPGIRSVVNSATNPGNIYTFFAMDDAGGDGSKNFGLSLNTYTSFGSGLVGVIYGGGNYNGSTDAIYFVSSSIRMLKPTTFSAPVTFNSSTTFNSSISATSITASNGFFVPSANDMLRSTPSTSSVANSYTRYGKDGFQIYQYQGQAYAFGVICTSDQLNAYTGSQFRWGTVNGTGAIDNYMNMISASYTGSIGAGTPIPGIDVLKSGQILQVNKAATFDKAVYIQQGLFVSQSAGGGIPALTVNGTSAPKSVVITGSVDFALASGGSNTFTNYLTSSFAGPSQFTNKITINNSAIPNQTGSALITYDSGSGTVGYSDFKSVLPKLFDVGAFSSTVTQSGSANVSQSFQFDSTLPINEITLTNGSHINIPTTAYYNIQFSIQIVQGSGAADVAVWLKKNGNNVSNSATYVTVPSNQKSVLALNLWDSANAGDYYELAYQSDSGNTTYAYVGPTGNIPGSPSVILTINQVR